MKRLFNLMVFLITAISIHAQGIYIYKADGTRIRLMNAEVDSIVVFGQEEINVGEHEAVDLGLSVKWATCNIGASSMEDYGCYFAWGETAEKSSYDSDNCNLYGIGYSNLQRQGVIDSDGNLTANYDAATVNWGGCWRMPTLTEIKELFNNCTWTWTTQNGINGYNVTGTNGNSIFLPAAGYRYGESLYYDCSRYWSSTASRYGGSYEFHFSSGYRDWSYYNFDKGQSVRPVLQSVN